ncbi:MAG TPA: xanthine dehydrogenase family protein subunit M [Vicinamibacterales bacterium]|nr:xanthine dehydrogenase family protein subunit M [Vicinamibacterales bacterium]
MYSPAFDYHRASSLADAHRLLAAHPGAKLLAGGHSLIPLLKLRLATPAAVIDIGRIDALRGITESGGHIRIGALTTHAEVASSSLLQSAAAALTDAAGLVGDPAVRNRGTIGGNIAHADPASDVPTALVALGADIVAARDGGERTIAAEDFFTGIMTTALADNEIISAVLVPKGSAGRAAAYVKFPHPASRYAVVGAAAVITRAGGRCTAARVALGGLVSHARRSAAVENALIGTPGDDAAVTAAAAAVSADLGDDATGDIYASAEYRKAMAPVFVKRAIAAALARTGTD